MKSCEYVPNLFYSRTSGILSGIFIVISCAILLFSIWSMCCLLGGVLGTV